MHKQSRDERMERLSCATMTLFLYIADGRGYLVSVSPQDQAASNIRIRRYVAIVRSIPSVHPTGVKWSN
jgi:hypothetical protein